MMLQINPRVVVVTQVFLVFLVSAAGTLGLSSLLGGSPGRGVNPRTDLPMLNRDILEGMVKDNIT